MSPVLLADLILAGYLLDQALPDIDLGGLSAASDAVRKEYHYMRVAIAEMDEDIEAASAAAVELSALVSETADSIYNDAIFQVRAAEAAGQRLMPERRQVLEKLAGIEPPTHQSHVLDRRLACIALKCGDLHKARKYSETARDSLLEASRAHLILAALAHLGDNEEEARHAIERSRAAWLDGYPFAWLLWEIEHDLQHLHEMIELGVRQRAQQTAEFFRVVRKEWVITARAAFTSGSGR